MLTGWRGRGNVDAMDPIFLALIAVVVVATIAWYAMHRRADAGLTPDEHLEQAALRGERDRGRTDAVEGADRFNLNG